MCLRDVFQPDDAVEIRAKAGVVADHKEGQAVAAYLFEQKVEEGGLAVGVQCRGGFVGDDYGRAADQGAGDGNALLLADAEGRGLRVQNVGKVQGAAEVGGGGAPIFGAGPFGRGRSAAAAGCCRGPSRRAGG